MGVGVGFVYMYGGRWLYSRMFLCSTGSVFHFICPPLYSVSIVPQVSFSRGSRNASNSECVLQHRIYCEHSSQSLWTKYFQYYHKTRLNYGESE